MTNLYDDDTSHSAKENIIDTGEKLQEVQDTIHLLEELHEVLGNILSQTAFKHLKSKHDKFNFVKQSND